MTISKILRKARRDMDIPQKKVCEDLNISICTLGRMEKNARQINVKKLEDLLKYYGIELIYKKCENDRGTESSIQ